ncbi:MAG: glycosyltransferase [Candidatus Omnitrophica bacterium]|nr:glycosyltransferase [Candidatus Omnitrophota bacterium]
MMIFVIPVYNEEKNIKSLLRNVFTYVESKKWSCKIILADDGSTDSTVSIANGMKGTFPLEVVSNPVNMGPGAAFDSGFRQALKNTGEDDIIITMEADNTSDIGILDKMIAEMDAGTEIVLASCYAKEGTVEGATLCRKILSYGANIIVRMLSRDKKINTFSSFYRCYRSGILSKAYTVYGSKFIEENGFLCAVDILLKLQRLGVQVKEVPMILRSSKRVGKSKMKTIKTILSYLKLFVKEGIRSVVNTK